MLSSETRRARARLANACKLGHDDVAELRTAYEVERACDAIQAISGATTRAQRGRLRAAVEATGDGEQG